MLNTPKHALLDAGCKQFLLALHQKFEPTRQALLAARQQRAAQFDAGDLPDFPAETAQRRADAEWQTTRTPEDLQDRRVEITGPCSRKMVINALNSGAQTFMACLEDATSPHWENVIDGQVNLRDAIAKTIAHTDSTSGKQYALTAERPATLIVRPRGWHLSESHVRDDSGQAIAGALFDFGVYIYHNAQTALDNGTGPYFYLPKLEHYLEARLWAEVLAFAEAELKLPPQSIKVTVLIETLPGAFHAEDIICELREYLVGLNCGRWDYIFSYIKVFRRHADRILPDRAAVTMAVPFMRAYCLHVIDVCHRRGAHAIGGMAAQIPVRGDDAANAEAFARVRADKTREATDGHDGTWVAHPGLVGLAREVFDAHMPGPNQLEKASAATNPSAAALIAPCDGARSMAGVRMNIEVGITYIAAWLGGLGAVPIHHLMEDAATAEICRSQLWQWRVHGVQLDSGEQVGDKLLLDAIAAWESAKQTELGAESYAAQRFPDAVGLFREMVMADTPPDFLTLPAYDRFLAA